VEQHARTQAENAVVRLTHAHPPTFSTPVVQGRERRTSNPDVEVRLLPGFSDTVAERRGSRLQSALRRFDSARCL
jgi:hypothetical protein